VSKIEFYSNYRSHEDEIMKIANEVPKKHFDSETEITIKEEWNKDENFDQTQPFPSENKENNLSDKGLVIWSEFDNEGYKPYKCTKCKEAFEFNKDLLLHIEVTHENKRPFQCSKCDHSFYKEVGLIFHTCNFLVSSVHQCSVCYISFASARAMIAHSRVHKRDEKKDNNPQNNFAIIYETKIPKEDKIQKLPPKNIRLADEDFENEIEIIPNDNKKEQKVQKPTTKKTKPKNTDLTFSDKEHKIQKLPKKIRLADEDLENKIEIIPTNNKKEPIIKKTKSKYTAITFSGKEISFA
jgi:DNA-directed RNA polymerase subunit RPC12/RpoP